MDVVFIDYPVGRAPVEAGALGRMKLSLGGSGFVGRASRTEKGRETKNRNEVKNVKTGFPRISSAFHLLMHFVCLVLGSIITGGRVVLALVSLVLAALAILGEVELGFHNPVECGRERVFHSDVSEGRVLVGADSAGKEARFFAESCLELERDVVPGGQEFLDIAAKNKIKIRK